MVCLLGISVATAAARNAPTAPPTTTGHRVTLPQVGLTVTFPAGWRTQWVPRREGLTFWAGNLLASEHCSVSRMPLADSLDEAAKDTLITFERAFGDGSASRVDVDLPVGPSLRVDAGLAAGTPDWSIYHFAIGDGLAKLTCRAHQPPDDRWVHFADTLESLGAASTATATDWAFDPRVEMAHLGFAVSFPAEWQVVGSVPGHGFHAGENVLVALNLEPRVASECWIEDHTGMPATGADGEIAGSWHEALIDSVRLQATLDEPEVSYVDLHAGRALRIDWRWPRWEPTKEQPATTWALSSEGRRVLLRCSSHQPPDDRWRSIAETFEFLPAEE